MVLFSLYLPFVSFVFLMALLTVWPNNLNLTLILATLLLATLMGPFLDKFMSNRNSLGTIHYLWQGWVGNIYHKPDRKLLTPLL